MERPENYSYYVNKNNGIPFRDWPDECKRYKNYQRIIRLHPEWATLTMEEIKVKQKENHQKAAANARKVNQVKWKNLSEEEKKNINKKKGSFYQNMSEEEKKAHNEVLRERSQKFWDGMSDQERKDFGKYRWDLKTEAEKLEIINRFNQAGVERMKNLSKEEIDRQIAAMNETRKKKLEEDLAFRFDQIALLRFNNEEYFNSLTEEERKEHYENMVAKSVAKQKEMWENDPEYREKQIERLIAISPLGSSVIKDKWENDPEFRSRNLDILNKARYEFWKSLDAKERSKILTRNKLNQRFEKQFNSSILRNDFIIEPEYIIKNDESVSTNKWDYAIFDKNTKELVLLLDLDGKFYHGDSNDYTDIHSNEDVDERRGYFVPSDVKIQIITEDNFIDGFKELMKQLYMNYDEYIESLFHQYKNMAFPYPHYTNKELIDSIKQLIRFNPEHKYLTLSSRNREGDRLIQHFHHSIYHAKKNGNISPYQAWNDDKLLRKCIENRTLYRTSIDPNKILQGFNVSKIAPKVSVFSAGRAKMIINKYLSQYNEIFDPFSGFSGRMLGAISLGKRYIGQDLSGIHVEESNKIIDFLKRTINHYPNMILPTVIQKDILKSSGECHSLFTCPPYSDKEIWQCNICDKRTCDDWLDECLSRFKCERYVFIVDNTVKYKEYIVDEIVNKSHLGKNNEYVIVIDR